MPFQWGGKFRNIPRYLTGLTAVLLAAYFLADRFSESAVALASIYFIIACICDTLRSKIPNLLNASLAIAGLALFYYADGWPGLLSGLTGLALGLSLLLLPWLMGGVGAGDVKALGALGALLGPSGIFQVFIYMALYGGVMAVLHYCCERNIGKKAGEWVQTFRATVLTRDPNMIIPATTETLRFPYAAAIAFGFYTYLGFGAAI